MIHLICGKVCSGKSYYAARLARRERAVILSCDELSLSLFPEGLGTAHDAMMNRVQSYLHARALDILHAGGNVILEWGFWRRGDRAAAEALYAEQGIAVQWHYLDVPEEVLKQNIEGRNKKVLEGADRSYYVDDGLFQKMLSLFEAPEEAEIAGNWTVVSRKKS